MGKKKFLVLPSMCDIINVVIDKHGCAKYILFVFDSALSLTIGSVALLQQTHTDRENNSAVLHIVCSSSTDYPWTDRETAIRHDCASQYMKTKQGLFIGELM